MTPQWSRRRPDEFILSDHEPYTHMVTEGVCTDFDVYVYIMDGFDPFPESVGGWSRYVRSGVDWKCPARQSISWTKREH